MQPDMGLWTGRVDPEPRTERWHQVVAPLGEASPPGRVLIGFRSDEGVRRNKGRPGAVDGPLAIRKALGPLAWHSAAPVYDAGDIACADGDLDAAHDALADAVAGALRGGHLPLVMGGGHEMAYGSWLGLARHAETLPAAPVIGIVNFDAHFDLRSPEFVISSGTPFAQIARACAERSWPFRYLCFGVSQAANTANLFERAEEFGVRFRLDRDMTLADLDAARQELAGFLAGCDLIYMTTCLDVFPAAVAPGVSAPAARGVAVEVIEPLIESVRDSGKLAVADIAELSPGLDPDVRTARLAARLLHTMSRSVAGGPST